MIEYKGYKIKISEALTTNLIVTETLQNAKNAIDELIEKGIKQNG